MIRRQQLTIEEALRKARHYCAYQERCHQEVKEKLYSFGLFKKDTELALSRLIEENYLNEERYAIQFAGGHFRMKQWGFVKIRYELKQKLVSEYCIKKALTAIDREDYLRTLSKLAEGKWQSLRDETHPLLRRKKLQDYLMQKGYEVPLIREAIARLTAHGE